MSLTIRSTAFEHGAVIPLKHTVDGDDVSPPLEWECVPKETAELVLICDDPDAPTPQPWVHWLIYGMAADLTGLPEAVPVDAELSAPIVARQGKNSWPMGQTVGYRGPAPPPGHGTHHYHFRLYAVSEPLGLPAGVDRTVLDQALAGKVLETAVLVGTYHR